MLSLYYRIWVDLIKRAKTQPENRETWPMGAMIFMSIAMSSNFTLILTILQKQLFGFYFYYLEFTFLPNYAATVISFIILFVLPCVLINYFLIFYRQKYKSLLKKYPMKEGRLFLTYFFISMLSPIVLIILGIVTGKIRIIF
jgi:ABC-type uncharacterized transport system fused permease/ATPase subunit